MASGLWGLWGAGVVVSWCRAEDRTWGAEERGGLRAPGVRADLRRQELSAAVGLSCPLLAQERISAGTGAAGRKREGRRMGAHQMAKSKRKFS